MIDRSIFLKKKPQFEAVVFLLVNLDRIGGIPIRKVLADLWFLGKILRVFSRHHRYLGN